MKRPRPLPFLLFAAGLFLVGQAFALTLITRISFDPKDDIEPEWDPAGNTIVYRRPVGATGDPRNFYYSLGDGSVTDQAFLTGPTGGFGTANSASWIGSTGYLAFEERVTFFEYMKFNSAGGLPFNRTVADGNDPRTTRLLLISGGGGGGRLVISRDGSTAAWRWSASGGSGTQQIRFGPVSSLLGGAADSTGTVLASTSHASEQRLLSRWALTPAGDKLIVPLPAAGIHGSSAAVTDLWIIPTDGSGSFVNLTNTAATGISSQAPVVSPDGSTLYFSRWSGVSGETWDLYSMNLDGSNLQQLTHTAHFYEYWPTLSPDGTRLAFYGGHQAGFENDFIPLLPGESANANIYVGDLFAIPEPGLAAFLLGLAALIFARAARQEPIPPVA